MNAWILAAEAFAVYGLVLWAHSLRHRFGLAIFYALLGSLTAIMSWVTDANVQVKLGDITFLVGSTVFYTSLLLGVFVVYVFDGPRATRVSILTVVGVSALAPVISLVLNTQMQLSSTIPLAAVPVPSLRINTASLLTTLADLLFLAVSWEYLHSRLSSVPLALKSFLTLLGVMWLDVLLFNTGAFLGQANFFSIISGTFFSRLVITLFAAPILWAYLSWQNSLTGVSMPHRPVFAILQELSELRVELHTAQEEIQRRKSAEALLARSERRYRQLVLNASEPIAVLQNDLFLLHNSKLLELTGIHENDILDASFSEFVHPEDWGLVEAAEEKALKNLGTANSVEFRAMDAMGAPMMIQANIVGIEWDGHGAMLAFLHDVTEQRNKELMLKTKVTEDELTGVFNRRGFAEAFNAFAAESSKERRAYSVLYLDVDNFKAINDRHGHATGDQVLRTVAQAVRSQIREGDFVGRMGGDEFAILLDGADSAEAQAIARRILDIIPSVCGQACGERVKVSASIGYAQCDPERPCAATELLNAADQAMFQAKRRGGNQAQAAGSAV